MTKEQVIAMAREAGFNASVGKTDKQGNYTPYVNALGRDVPFEWIERFATLVRNAALEEAWQAAQPDDAYRDQWFEAKADACRRINLLKEPTT